MGKHLSEIPDDPPGRGKTVGGCVYYDSPPAVIEAACRAYFPWWDDMFGDEQDGHRSRMRAALRAAIDTTCSPALTQAEGER
ncbi:hypothetical protein ACLBYG_22630 [Methylobacterium sp. D53M]